jgi:hypothetical protein
MAFAEDGGFYGDHLISTGIAFGLQGTVQVDLGGAVGLQDREPTSVPGSESPIAES